MKKVLLHDREIPTLGDMNDLSNLPEEWTRYLLKRLVSDRDIVCMGMDVTENSPASMSVKVIPDSTKGYGLALSEDGEFIEILASEAVPLSPADPVSPRIDIIIAAETHTDDDEAYRYFRTQGSGMEQQLVATRQKHDYTVTVLEGTPGSGAAPATPEGYVKLAEVTVGAGVTEILNANIKDVDDSDTWTTAAESTVREQKLGSFRWFERNGYYYLEYNGNVIQKIDSAGNIITGTTGLGTINGWDIGGMMPVGTIIAWDDRNGALSFNANYWAHMDGSQANVAGIGIITLQDASGRYLVGYGTDGGGNIDTAAWSASPVGNSNHQISLQHAHSMPTHKHTGPLHNHSLSIVAAPNHVHASGSLRFTVARFYQTNKQLVFYLSDGTPYYLSVGLNFSVGGGTNRGMLLDVADAVFHTAPGGSGTVESNGGHGHSGTVANGGNSDTSETGLSMSNELSATQSIQPRSVPVRFLYKIK